jgi:hypothetical protein
MRKSENPVSVRSRLAVTAALVITLYGCGGGLMAPDPLRENPEAEAFLDRVAKNCGDKSIGINFLNELINDTQDAYFIDVTTKLFVGTITKAQYRSDIDGLYPASNNEAGIDCIFSQM